MNRNDKLIAIIGLGYVGLPLAVEFGKLRNVIGYDIDPIRIRELQEGYDRTQECDSASLGAAEKLRFSHDSRDLNEATIFIVAVPTPIDKANHPDLLPLIGASETIGASLKNGDLVIYESTVYPGATEEICVPVLELASGLQFNKHFFCGYSPERINPGDKVNTLVNIKKITSGSNPEAAEEVDKLYKSIIVAGTHCVSSMKVAEAAKIVENTQRDLNIALMNELSLIFHKLQVDTLEVLEAAGTKWNFLPFRPGLVGGHCIGVDPYYLTHKAQSVGYHPEVILAGRRVNNNIVQHVADTTVKLMLKKRQPINGGKVLVLGVTFKENCPDLRNSKVIPLIEFLTAYHLTVDVFDPWVDVHEAREKYGINCLDDCPQRGEYAAIVVAVGHRQFIEMGASVIRKLGAKDGILFDVKGIFPRQSVDCRL